ncbi:uncharacterized protein LOC110928985 [Helianthus annuus]|uniref:uncharacterized protein LOC110928985 n=1 Tax=Helianthus annuus TaxID=4232 RepID=UPI000B8F04FC|nr:uncharacterized protein LOC110928985 [Helianthus annuus]
MASYFSSLMWGFVLTVVLICFMVVTRILQKRRQMAIEDTILTVDQLIVETYMMTSQSLLLKGYHEYFDHETGQFRSLLMVFGRYALKLVVRSSFLFLLQSHKIRSTWRCLIRVKTEWTIPSVFL